MIEQEIWRNRQSCIFKATRVLLFPLSKTKTLNIQTDAQQEVNILLVKCSSKSRFCLYVQTKFVGMMQYDGDLKLPARFLVPPPAIHGTSGEILAKNGITTFACSETQKFGHVSYQTSLPT